MDRRMGPKWDRNELPERRSISDVDKEAIAAWYRAECLRGRTSEEVFQELGERYGRSPRQIQRYVQQPPSPGVVPEVALDAQTAHRHRETLLAPLLELREIGLLAFNNYDLATWYSRTDPCWPITKGRACREADGGLLVHLDAEEKLEWQYLRQHLPGDPVWATVDGAKRAMVADLAARLDLLSGIIGRIEKPAEQGGLNLPVDLNLPYGGGDRPAVGLPYAFALHEQLVARALGLGHGPIRPTTPWQNSGNPNALDLTCGPAVVSPSSQQREAAVHFLVETQSQWVELPEVQKTASAYREAELKVHAVKTHLERLRLASAFPRASLCDGCRDLAL